MKRSQTELSLSAVAHLNQSVFLLVEEDFHSLDVPVHTCNTQHTTTQHSELNFLVVI